MSVDRAGLKTKQLRQRSNCQACVLASCVGRSHGVKYSSQPPAVAAAAAAAGAAVTAYGLKMAGCSSPTTLLSLLLLLLLLALLLLLVVVAQGLNMAIADLQRLSGKKDENKQSADHSHTVVDNLRSRLKDATLQFKDVLTMRTENLKVGPDHCTRGSVCAAGAAGRGLCTTVVGALVPQNRVPALETLQLGQRAVLAVRSEQLPSVNGIRSGGCTCAIRTT
jgi:hypothetical protein